MTQEDEEDDVQCHQYTLDVTRPQSPKHTVSTWSSDHRLRIFFSNPDGGMFRRINFDDVKRVLKALLDRFPASRFIVEIGVALSHRPPKAHYQVLEGVMEVINSHEAVRGFELYQFYTGLFGGYEKRVSPEKAVELVETLGRGKEHLAVTLDGPAIIDYNFHEPNQDFYLFQRLLSENLRSLTLPLLWLLSEENYRSEDFKSFLIHTAVVVLGIAGSHSSWFHSRQADEGALEDLFSEVHPRVQNLTISYHLRTVERMSDSDAEQIIKRVLPATVRKFNYPKSLDSRRIR